MNKYIIHVGYAKCASTLLQSTIFSGDDCRIKTLNPKNNNNGKKSVKSGSDLFYNKNCFNPLIFDERQAKKNLNSKLLDNVDNQKSNIICLSNEDWAGHPFNGGACAKEYANRIKATIPNAKILIIIREQVNMILSCYAHYLVKSSGVCSLENFLEYDFSRQHLKCHTDFFCYSTLVEYYYSLFSPENVLVLPFEKLLQNGTKDFLDEIYNFIGLTQLEKEYERTLNNKRDYKTYAALRFCPFFNLFDQSRGANGYIDLKSLSLIKKIYLSFIKLTISEAGVEKTLQKDKEIIEEIIKKKVIKDNEILSNLINFNLSQYGYLDKNRF